MAWLHDGKLNDEEIKIHTRLTDAENDALLTINEMSEWLAVDKRTIQRYVRVGLLPQPISKMTVVQPNQWRVGTVIYHLRAHGKPDQAQMLEKYMYSRREKPAKSKSKDGE